MIGIRALAAAEHRTCDEAVDDGVVGVLIHVAVFARTVHRTHDDSCGGVVDGISQIGDKVDFHDGIARVSQGAELVAVAGLTTRGAVHITTQGWCRHRTDVATRDVDLSLAIVVANIEKVKFVRPAERVALMTFR